MSKIIINQPRSSYYVGGAEIVSFEHAKYLSKKMEVVFITINPTSVGKAYSEHYVDFKEYCRRVEGIEIVEIDIPKEYVYIYEYPEGSDRCRWNRESVIYGSVLNDIIRSIREYVNVLSYYIVDGIFLANNKSVNNILYLCGVPRYRDDFQGGFLIAYDNVLSISDSVSKYWLRYSEYRDIPVIHTGVDIDRYNLFDKEYCRGGVIRIIYLGRLLERKGVYIFAEIAKKFREIYPNVVDFICVGDGVEYDNLKIKYGDRIKFLSQVSNVENILKESDILLSPSLYGEGLQGVILEAMASGVVVIASDSEINKDLLGCGRGYVCKPSIGEFSKILNNVLQLTPFEMRDIGLAARRYVEDRYSWEKSTNKLYKELF